MGAPTGMVRSRAGRGWPGHVGYRPLNRRVESIAQARAAIRSFMGVSLSPEDEHAVALVVSELVANAVQHGEEPIQLRVATSPGCIHIEVTDAGNLPPGDAKTYAPSRVRRPVVGRASREDRDHWFWRGHVVNPLTAALRAAQSNPGPLQRGHRGTTSRPQSLSS